MGNLSRRRAVVVVASAGTAGLAGCSSELNPFNSEPAYFSDDPETVLLSVDSITDLFDAELTATDVTLEDAPADPTAAVGFSLSGDEPVLQVAVSVFGSNSAASLESETAELDDIGFPYEEVEIGDRAIRVGTSVLTLLQNTVISVEAQKSDIAPTVSQRQVYAIRRHVEANDTPDS